MRAFITAGPTEPDPHQERHSCFLFALVLRGSDKPRGCSVPGLSCPARARPLAPERLLHDEGPSWDRGVVGQADPCCQGEAPPTPSLACAPVWAGRPAGAARPGPAALQGPSCLLPPSSGSPAAPGPGPSPRLTAGQRPLEGHRG